jgi:hypothetical protein
MSLPLYSKLDKNANDFFKNDDFDLQKKFSVKVNSAAGVVFTSSLTGETVAPSEGDAAGKTAFTGNLKAEYKDKKFGEVTGETNTKNLLSLTWKTPEFLTKGLKAEVKAKSDRCPKTNDLKCNVSVEEQYLKNNTASTFSVNLANKDDKSYKVDTSVGFSTVVGFDGLVFGGEVEHNLSKLTKGNLATGFLKNGTSVVAKTSGLLDALSVSYHQVALPRVSVSAVGNYKFKDGSKSFKFGLSHELDSLSSVRTVFATDSKSTTVSALYSALLNKNSKLSLSTVVDAGQFVGGSHKFGVKLELGDL